MTTSNAVPDHLSVVATGAEMNEQIAAYCDRFDKEVIQPIFRKLADLHYRRLYRNLSIRKKIVEKRCWRNLVIYGTNHPEAYKS